MTTSIIGLLVPMLGIVLGSAVVFLTRKEMSGLLQKSLLGFAAGVMMAVTIHHFPEGMAIGVVLAGAGQAGVGISAASALVVSLGIAIQNIPEGAVVSIPMRASGKSRTKSFLLGFAAGAMLYVVVEELIPEASSGQHTNLSTIFFAVGFALMMLLDVVLG